MSLRLRILSLTVGATAVVLVLLAVPLWILLHRAAAEEGREQATEAARSVADYVSTGDADSTTLAAYVDRVNDRENAIPVSVVTADGTVVGAELPDTAVQDLDPHRGGGSDPDDDGDRDGGLMPVSEPEVHEISGGELVTVHVSTTDGGAVVVAYSSDADARAAVRDRLYLLGGVAVALLALAAGAAEVVSRRLVRQLDATAAVADRLSQGDLAARATESGPSEVRRVSVALNRLAGRIDELLAAERETVADLSHRLRTPLTAVRLDVESLPSSPEAQELEAHLDHLERTLTDVIRAARRPEREGALPRCEPATTVAEGVDFWRPLIEDQGRVLDVDVERATHGATVACAPDDLRSAVDALIENCIAHTPEETPLAVSLGLAGGVLHLEVRDRGPGLPPDAVHRGRSDRGSTGLGLDIARRCAESCGGRLETDRLDGWTVVRLVLPIVAQPGHRSI
ncbi:sensor histidine kinase [Nocardioides mangrovi]|uniref:histidine kinase n=1 Tax=Nocardioides mangrovi TaxID=2874580 RepID=A0ABS7UAY9_9ACTN|nr:HAMP domain-containing sensor histidine kinase [Nocardioides mangrovi]MBZ5737886.1 HAMP domain-containing histidine kinase [Nocardioides mangrovi]